MIIIYWINYFLNYIGGRGFESHLQFHFSQSASV